MNKKGLGVAMVTPFQTDLSVDYGRLELLTEELITGGVDFLVVMGTTGEAATLSSDEKKAVLKSVISANSRRVPIVYGLGGNNTLALAGKFKKFSNPGVDAILSASPGYNKPPQEGIYRHYQKLDKVTNHPIIVYNVPGRTASNITAETTLRLASDMNSIVGVKEASGDLEQIKTIINNAPKGFLIYSGDDALTEQTIEAGGHGVISVLGNAFPKPLADIVKHHLAHNKAERAEFDYLHKLIPLLFKEGNPAGIKALMSELGHCEPHVRLPLISASEELKASLKMVLDATEVV